MSLLAAAGIALLAGCSNSHVDTAKVRASLQSIDNAYKPDVELAMAAIDAGKYKEALMPLRKIAVGAKLDKDQQKIVKDTLKKVEIHIAKGE